MNNQDIKFADPLMEILADRWWLLVVRGIAAVLFGILTLILPGVSLLALVYLWGAYALVDGFFNLMLGARRGRAGARWGWFIFEGILSIAAGVLTFAWPGITALVLLFLIAAWAVLTGIAEIAAAIGLRNILRHEWLLGLVGVLSIVFGIMLFARPRAGALAVASLIGIYAILFGTLLIGLGARVHRWSHPCDRTLPTGASSAA